MSDFLNQFDVPAIKGPVHETQVDRSFHHNKIIKLGVIAIAVIAVCVTGIFIFHFANRIDIKPLTGTDINEARNWALRNRIELNVIHEFNLENNKDIIFAQNPENGKIQRGSAMSVTVSDGADPYEILTLPDFGTMNINEVRSWRSENKADNVNVVQEYDDEVKSGDFLRLDFPSDMVNENNYSRKDIMVVYMSKGEETVLADIAVPNFRGKPKEEVESWAESNNIKIIFKEEDSDEIMEGCVISQSVKSGVNVAAEHKIKVVVSLGKGVMVPNFNTIFMNNINTTDLTVDIAQKYNVNIPYGGLISQSLPAGTKLYGENKKISVVYSLGRPYIDNLIGSSEKELSAYFHDLRSNGANITYTTKYVSGSEPKGSIVSASHNSEFVGLSLNVHFEISRGNREPDLPE